MKRIFLAIPLLLPFYSFGNNDTLKMSLLAGAQWSDGNIKNESVNGAFDLFFRKNRSDVGSNITYKYLNAYPYPITPTSTPSRQNEFYSNSHFTWRIDKIWKLMAFSELEHSQLRKIEERVNLGAGVSERLISNSGTKLDLSEALLPDFWRSMMIKNAMPQRDNISLRISMRIKWIQKIGDLTLSSIQMIQPAIYSWWFREFEPRWQDNLIFRSTNSIEAPINSHLSMGLEGDLIYQSYLNAIAKDPGVIQSGIYLTPQDTYFSFILKYYIR